MNGNINIPYISKISSSAILLRIKVITELQNDYRRLNDIGSVNLIQKELDTWKLVLDEREAWEYEHGTAYNEEGN